MPHGINNNFIYAVSQIEVYGKIEGKDEECLGAGTGFYIKYDKKRFFVTNRHVVDDNYGKKDLVDIEITRVLIDHRKLGEDGKVKVQQRTIEYPHILYPEEYLDDIAVIYDMKYKEDQEFSPMVFEFDDLASEEEYQKDLMIGDELLIIGYPVVHDVYNNMPIVRGGIISSDPRLDYWKEKKFHGHIMAFEGYSKPGSSGSPVFAIQRGFQTDDSIQAWEGFYRRTCLIGINAGSVPNLEEEVLYDVNGKQYKFLKNERQNLARLYKSPEIRKLIEKANEESKKNREKEFAEKLIKMIEEKLKEQNLLADPPADEAQIQPQQQ